MVGCASLRVGNVINIQLPTSNIQHPTSNFQNPVTKGSTGLTKKGNKMVERVDGSIFGAQGHTLSLIAT